MRGRTPAFLNKNFKFTRNQFLLSFVNPVVISWSHTQESVSIEDDDDLLVRNAPEDNVVEQSDLLSQLHRWEGLKTLCLQTVCLKNAHTRKRAET